MNKRVLIICFCLAFSLLLLSGCISSNNEKEAGNPEANIIKPTEENKTENDINTLPSTSANGSGSDEDITNAPEVNPSQAESTARDYSKIGFELVKEESLFVLNNAVTGTDIIKLIGEPEEKSEAAVWGSDGLEHQTWYYKAQGLKMDFITDNSNIQTVKSISISSPSKLKTSRGIGIGSTRDEILKAYENKINQEEYSGDSGSIVAGTVYGGLIFELDDDKVTSIFIGAAAE